MNSAIRHERAPASPSQNLPLPPANPSHQHKEHPVKRQPHQGQKARRRWKVKRKEKIKNRTSDPRRMRHPWAQGQQRWLVGSSKRKQGSRTPTLLRRRFSLPLRCPSPPLPQIVISGTTTHRACLLGHNPYHPSKGGGTP